MITVKIMTPNIKFIKTLLIIFLFISNVFQTGTCKEIEHKNDFDSSPIELPSELTTETSNENEIPVLLENIEDNPYSKEALKGIIEKDYDINSPDGMLKRQLQLNFDKGPIKQTNSQFNFMTNFTENINDDNSNLKYNVSLINIGLKGKFKSEKEGFNFLFDVTPDIKENFFHRLILDAWVESKRIPHHTVMLGTSRPNVGYEGGQSPYTLPFIFRSQTARNFGNIRKTGLRVKGDYKYIDYDLGGFSSDTWYTEFFPGVEGDFWVNFKPLANLDKNKYGSLNLAGGFQAGSRNSVDFMVESAALRYNYKKFKLQAEYQNADGSNGASGLTDAKRWGYNVTLTYMLTKKLELLLRYDDFDPDKNKADNNIKEYTGGINYYILGQTLRLCLNYIFCDNNSKSNSHKIIFGTQLLL